MRVSTLFKSSLALPLLVAVGCGGSSGASSGYPSSPSSVGNPIGPGIDGGSALQALAVGQTWRYAVSGTISAQYLNSAAVVQTLSGKITNGTLVRVVTAAPSPFTGNTFEITDTFTFTVQGGVPTVETSTRYVTQGGDNSLVLVGVDKYGMQTSYGGSGVPLAPGTFTATTNLSGNLGFTVYNPGDSSVFTQSGSGTSLLTKTYVFQPGDANFETAFTALGQETVPASTGAAFTAWKTQTTETDTWDNNGLWAYYAGLVISPGYVIHSSSTKTSIDDWCPNIGAPVRSQVTLNQQDLVSTAFSVTAGSPTLAPSITYTEITLSKSENLQLALIARS